MKQAGWAAGLIAIAAFVSPRSGPMAAAPGQDGNRILVETVSTRPDRVSGGDVLVSVARPDGASGDPLVSLNGRDVSSLFAGDAWPRVALVAGLRAGKNTLTVHGKPWSVKDTSLTITNYPITGPIVSGPHAKPFICQTDTFKLPDGSVLGPSSDADCSIATIVKYVYLPRRGSEFKPLASTASLPDDVATASVNGRTVPLVVRVETGTINRGIYQVLVLHDPTRDPAPSPSSPPPGWNRRLIALHGVGCPTGWYRQGGVMGVNPLTNANVARLAEGYAIFTNTLNHPTNSCNPILAGETTMMTKEHVVETLGRPDFTVSIGSSGGAYTGLQVGDAFPGLFDGVLYSAAFPDALSIALSGLDAHLLTHYFSATDPGAFTDPQKIAVSGYQGMKAFIDAANQSQRTDPVPDRADVAGYESARWHESVPLDRRYDPKTNPRGARPTVFDAARNVYGVDERTGFALRPFDNVGVQYGLAALNAGAITPKQFLDLNEKIGGYDQDANYVAARSEGDAGAIRRAHQGGMVLDGAAGLASIPVFDDGAYNDERGYHYQWFHFAIRERLTRPGAGAPNHVMWRGPVQADRAWDTFIKWVSTKQRPPEAVDGCASPAAARSIIEEPQTFSRKPDSSCNRRYPSYGFVRLVAGGPVAANILKCQLKPIDPRDYAVAFTADQQQRLKAIFPTGVCDWSRPGVNQTHVVPWPSFGPAPENLVFDVTARKSTH